MSGENIASRTGAGNDFHKVLTMTESTTIRALSEAIEDEYRARATYRKIIERFGPVRPFVNIVDAENRHVAVLLRQFERLRAEPPADT
jgi:rubrerythrin